MNPKLLLFILLLISISSSAQIDSILNKIDPAKWSAAVEKKVIRLKNKILAKNEKTLQRLQKQEEKIYQKHLVSKDSVEARLKLADTEEKYKALEARLKSPASIVPANAKQYIPHLDTLKTAFKFLNKNNSTANLTDALTKIESLDNKFQQAEEIKQFVRERREQLQQQLEQLGLLKELKKINKEVYYYNEQLKEYKNILNDPDKIERKAIELLGKTKMFQDFMLKNSMLASLFRMPSDINDPNYTAGLAGLQTRVQVNNLIQQQIASGGPNAQAQFQQNIQQGQSQLSQLKEKIFKNSSFGNGGSSSDDIMPNGFKPNNQKTKSFLKRLEYGTNMQAQRATNFFPATTDLGFSVGYKLNDKSIIGIGASYKVGLGRGWNHMELSSQGAGLRSYIDWKLKGSIWISGGYEMNYKSAFKKIEQLKYLNAWSESGLLGISKVIDVKSKFFKKTKLQLLWDFLSYQQTPRTQTIVFRVNYLLK